jgi:hypothetical protein
MIFCFSHLTDPLIDGTLMAHSNNGGCMKGLLGRGEILDIIEKEIEREERRTQVATGAEFVAAYTSLLTLQRIRGKIQAAETTNSEV